MLTHIEQCVACKTLYNIINQSSLFCHNAKSTKRRRETAKDLTVTKVSRTLSSNLNSDKALYNLKTITQKKEITQYSDTQRNKHKNYCFLIIPLNPNYDRVHFKSANTINIKFIKKNQCLNQKRIL